MDSQRSEGKGAKRDLALYVVAPTLGNIFVVTLFWLARPLLPAVLPAIYFVLAGAFLAVVGAFRGAFVTTIADRFAFFWLVVNGFLLILAFAFIHEAFPITFAGPAHLKTPETPTFSDSLYFSIVTFTTLGYGDFQPSPDLRLVSAIQALSGYVFLGFVVAVANDWMRYPTQPDGDDKQWDFDDLWWGIKAIVCRPAQAINAARKHWRLAGDKPKSADNQNAGGAADNQEDG